MVRPSVRKAIRLPSEKETVGETFRLCFPLDGRVRPQWDRYANASRDHWMFFFVRSKKGAKTESRATSPLSTIGPCTVSRGMNIKSPALTRLVSSPTRKPLTPQNEDDFVVVGLAVKHVDTFSENVDVAGQVLTVEQERSSDRISRGFWIDSEPAQGIVEPVEVLRVHEELLLLAPPTHWVGPEANSRAR